MNTAEINKLVQRNEVQAQTIEHMRGQYVEKLDALQLREAALALNSDVLKARYSWGFWRRLCFAFMGR